METSGNSGAIRFAGPAVTRAAIDDADGMLTDGNSFSVWGNYTDGTGGTATSVFNAEKSDIRFRHVGLRGHEILARR